jgi:hydrogenase nickel incorporation protein HypA/HybF
MHELGITQNIVAIVAEHANGRPVARVRVEVGKLSGVMSDAIRFCFDVVAKGTCLEGAELELIEIDGRGRCRACQSEFPTPDLFTACSCGSRNIERLAGEELNIREFEYADARPAAHDRLCGTATGT